MWRRGICIALLLIALPGLMLAPVWRNHGLGAGEDDLLYYFPMRALYARAVALGDWLPQWNPWNGLEQPFLADPQTAVFYPPTWLFGWAGVNLQNVGVAYAAHLWLHFLIAAWGMYRLLRSAELGRHAAIFGAVAFAFSGFMLAHRAHFTMQAAAAWTPWVLWRQARLAAAMAAGAGRRERIRKIALLAAVIALQCFAGHVAVVALTLFASGVLLLVQPFEARAPARDGSVRRRTAWTVLAVGAAWALAGAIFAVQAWPTTAYAALSARSGWSYWQFTENSYSPLSLLTLIFPFLYGQRVPNAFGAEYWGPSHQSEQFGYIGLIPLALALVALRAPWRSHPTRKPWFVLLIAAGLLALGRYGPVCLLLYWLPGSSAFRCPARALLLIDLALAVLAATVVDDLAREPDAARARLRAVVRDVAARPLARLLAVAVIGLGAVALAAISIPAARAALVPWNPAVLIPLGLLAAALAVLPPVVRNWRTPHWLVLLTLLTVADLTLVGWFLDVPPTPMRLPRDMQPDPENHWLGFVTHPADSRRLWVATTRPGWYPGEYIDARGKCSANINLLEPGVANLTSYGPLQPRTMAQHFGLLPWGQSTRVVELLEEPGLLRAVNVGWILVTDDALPAPTDANLITTSPAGYRLYELPGTPGLAHLRDAGVPVAIRRERLAWNRLHITVVRYPPPQRAHRPEQADELVLAIQPLPGWRALIDGVPAELRALDDLFLAVTLPAEVEVELELAYSTPGLKAGAGVSIAGLTLLLALVALGRRAKRS